MESFHSILKAECYHLHELKAFPQAYEVVKVSNNHSNKERCVNLWYTIVPYLNSLVFVCSVSVAGVFRLRV